MSCMYVEICLGYDIITMVFILFKCITNNYESQGEFSENYLKR